MLLSRPPRRVAIVKPSALGDIAHAVPVLTAVHELFPDAHISWVVNKAYEPLLLGHPHLNATIPFDRGAYKRSPVKAVMYSLRFANRLRRQRFDLVIDLQGLLRTGLMTAATGAAVRMGFAASREGSQHFYTHRIEVPDADHIHAVDRYWRIVEALGGGHLTKQFALPVQLTELTTVDRELEQLPRPWLALAPGARWLTKRWPVASFAQVANRAHAEFGSSVLLIGASDDITLSAELREKLIGPSGDYTGKTGIAKMVALLSRADVMLSNDTGPLHVAAALGVPCVAPYLCTRPRLHGPYPVFAATTGSGARSTVPRGRGEDKTSNLAIPTTVPCAGSYLRQCPHGLICMSELTPDRLWPSLQQVLRTCRRS
jgi:lipopolysaccharide heptosyltransferase II